MCPPNWSPLLTSSPPHPVLPEYPFYNTNLKTATENSPLLCVTSEALHGLGFFLSPRAALPSSSRTRAHQFLSWGYRCTSLAMVDRKPSEKEETGAADHPFNTFRSEGERDGSWGQVWRWRELVVYYQRSWSRCTSCHGWSGGEGEDGDAERRDPPQVLEQVRGGDPGPVVGGCLGQSSDLHPCIEWEGGRVWVQIWEACHVS